ncbi:hypothetical protein [Brevibacillus sp. H7]|uniref:hypothetical protein n=1 Tax=Brevibacillus sp. H7 TaxID=3349138 RepID=UPI00380388D2
MKLVEAKQQLVQLQHFVQLVESYKVTSFETAVIYEYAIEGNVTAVAKKLNEQGHHIDGRKITSSDVSAVLKQKPIDELHKIISNFFKNNKKQVQKLT